MRLGKRLNSFADLAPHDHLEGVGATVADPVFCSREEALFITGLCLGLTFSLWGHNGLSLHVEDTGTTTALLCECGWRSQGGLGEWGHRDYRGSVPGSSRSMQSYNLTHPSLNRGIL